MRCCLLQAHIVYCQALQSLNAGGHVMIVKILSAWCLVAVTVTIHSM